MYIYIFLLVKNIFNYFVFKNKKVSFKVDFLEPWNQYKISIIVFIYNIKKIKNYYYESSNRLLIS